MPRFVMVWGTSSGAGKSWLATPLCRSGARRGTAVKPFKAQNMSNNARVVAGLDGLGAEIGAAQYFQALAAGVEPHVDMNPVVLKPGRGAPGPRARHAPQPAGGRHRPRRRLRAPLRHLGPAARRPARFAARLRA